MVITFLASKLFYDLAKKYNKPEKVLAFFGIVLFYGSLLISFITIVGICIYTDNFDLKGDNTCSKLILPFTFLLYGLVYGYLNYTWRKNKSLI